jgi:hypothetical protein
MNCPEGLRCKLFNFRSEVIVWLRFNSEARVGVLGKGQVADDGCVGSPFAFDCCAVWVVEDAGKESEGRFSFGQKEPRPIEASSEPIANASEHGQHCGSRTQRPQRTFRKAHGSH